MNIQRFTAPNSREALAKARLAFKATNKHDDLCKGVAQYHKQKHQTAMAKARALAKALAKASKV